MHKRVIAKLNRQADRNTVADYLHGKQQAWENRRCDVFDMGTSSKAFQTNYRGWVVLVGTGMNRHPVMVERVAEYIGRNRMDAATLDRLMY